MTVQDDSYLIDLVRWGITVGFPSKSLQTINGTTVNSYTDQAYINAYNNLIGFNNAIDWAYQQGYRNIIVPKGDYAVCYANVSKSEKQNSIVINYDNLVFDFNGSTFKVIYDSAKRNPYDKILSNGIWVTNTAPIYKFCGKFLIVRDCKHTIVRNGTVIGDKLDRDFSVQDEKSVEGSYGICSGGNCSHIVIEQIDISFFMGDGFTNSISATNVTVRVGYQMNWQVGSLDATGNKISDSTQCVSDFLPVNATTPYYLQGYGYTQGMTALQNKKYSIYAYDSSKTFITKLPDTFVLRSFTTTAKTAFVRLVVQETTVDPNGWQMTLNSGTYGSFVVYQHNKIHHCHRGGMTIGVNDMFIINNNFYNNGSAPDHENNLPGFEQSNGQPFSTRYHINMEDSQGFNINIIGNTFSNGQIGLAARGWNYTVKDNVFTNVPIGIILYKIPYAIVDSNYFDNSAFTTFGYNISDNVIRDWLIKNNVFNGTFTINGTALIDSITNNLFFGQVTIPCLVRTFKDNTFHIDQSVGYSMYLDLSTIPIIEGCKFEKSPSSTEKNTIQIRNAKVINCTFTKLKVAILNVDLKNCVITDSGFQFTAAGSATFESCTINRGPYTLLNNYATIPDNSALLLCIYDGINVLFKDSNITCASSSRTFGTDNNKTYKVSLRFENTTLSKTGSNKIGFDVMGGTLTFINSKITSETSVSYTPNPSLIHQFTDSTFTNVTFNTKKTDIQYSQNDIGILARPLSGSGAPTIAPQKIGQEYFDTTNKKLYKAFGTTGLSDWIPMN
jgi:hypothetical protein